MSEEKKEYTRKTPLPDSSAGILKDKEKKDLENKIVDTLKNLNGHMTKKEILALIHRIEVSKGLEGLRTELKKEKTSGREDIPDEVLQDILNLFREVEKIAELGLQELKLDIVGLNESKEYTVEKAIYLTHRFPWIKKLEESKLGENIIIDIAGITVGALDSIHAIIKFLLTLISDTILFPKHIIDEIRKK